MWRLRSWLLILLFSLAGAGLMLWRYQAQRPAAVADGLRAAREALAPVVAPAGTVLAPPAKGTLTKCVSPGRSLYTDGPCPAGTQPAEVSGGSVTVLKTPPAPALAASASASGASHATIRDALLGSEAQMRELRDRRMDAVIGR